MKQGFKTALVGIAILCGLVTGMPQSAKADAISTFDLSGNFGVSQPGGFQDFFNLSGSITVDTTTGVVQSQTVLPPLTSFLPSTFAQGFDAVAKDYLLSIDGSIRFAQIYFDTPSLVNYTGGNLGSLTFPTLGGAVSGYQAQLIPSLVLQAGVATLEPVPEPGSTGLLLAGLGSLALLLVIRQAKR